MDYTGLSACILALPHKTGVECDCAYSFHQRISVLMLLYEVKILIFFFSSTYASQVVVKKLIASLYMANTDGREVVAKRIAP